LAVQVFNGNGANMPAVAAGTAEKYLRVGIVLFNEDGQLANLPYWVRALTVSGQNHLGDASHLNLKASLNPSAIPPAAGPTLYSHAAVCLYDEDSYVGQTAAATSDPFSDDDSNSYNYGNYFPATAPPANPLADKAVEQNWLDQNGEVLVIKPNDGSLLRNK
jgi:hypothetical protein